MYVSPENKGVDLDNDGWRQACSSKKTDLKIKNGQKLWLF